MIKNSHDHKMQLTPKSSIKKGEGMMDYYSAVNNAKTHKRIYQYTNFDALNKIICNRALRLTRLDLLNDTVENDNIADLWKKKVYVSCFTHRENESYFFWETYSRDIQNGIMVSFCMENLLNLSIHADEICVLPALQSCKKTDINKTFCENISAENWGIYDYSCLDITYVDRSKGIEIPENFQGRIKYSEWDSESETRIRIAVRPKCFEYDFKKSERRLPKDEYLYAKLPLPCLEAMTITLSPFADPTLKEKIEMLLKENDLYGKVRVLDSVIRDELQKKL